MKRGLKDVSILSLSPRRVSYNHYPDEKGTERRLGVQYTRYHCSYNHYPDEKGTESSR